MEFKMDTSDSNIRIEPAQRIKRLPPYLFGRLNALKLAKRQQGVDIIDLGMGNPSDGAPQIVIDKLCEAARDPRNHRYSASKGIKNLRGEIAKKYERLWNVQLDPETEVLACLGPKVGVPAYAFASLIAYRMLDTGDHWTSDVVFGAAIGWVVGHTFGAKHKQLEIAGFKVLPYTAGNNDSVIGVNLLKRF